MNLRLRDTRSTALAHIDLFSSLVRHLWQISTYDQGLKTTEVYMRYCITWSEYAAKVALDV